MNEGPFPECHRTMYDSLFLSCISIRMMKRCGECNPIPWLIFELLGSLSPASLARAVSTTSTGRSTFNPPEPSLRRASGRVWLRLAPPLLLLLSSRKTIRFMAHQTIQRECLTLLRKCSADPNTALPTQASQAVDRESAWDSPSSPCAARLVPVPFNNE